MKLLVTGGSNCKMMTFKRLLIVAEEVAFMDRPSVTFDGWGTIGISSELRPYVPAFEGKPVRLSVHAPPSGPASDLYLSYLKADLANPHFRRIFLKGIATNQDFAEKVVQLKGNYGSGTGAQVIDAIAHDDELQTADMNFEFDQSKRKMSYRIDDPTGRKVTFYNLIAEASIHLTNAMIVSMETGCVPVSDDPIFAELLSRRSSDRSYIGGPSLAAPFLGLEIVKTAIPDQALEKLEVSQILDYREKSKELYEGWSVELARLSTALDELSPGEIQRELPRIINAEVKPNLVKYKNEMKTITENLFGDVIKTISKWEVPTISLAYLSELSFLQAIGAFSAALTPVIPSIVDFVKSRRELKRSHSFSYLIHLAKEAGDSQ